MTVGSARSVLARGWFWGLVLLAYSGSATVLVLADAPSAYLLAGVVAGAAVALTTSDTRGLPPHLQKLGMAIVGVVAGVQIDADVLRVLVGRPAAVLGCVLATLIVSMACGQILRLSPAISPVTALFASIAGGASGVTAVVHEIGGDDAVVMSIQYLRVVAVIVAVPVATEMFDPAQVVPAPAVAHAAMWSGLAYTLVSLCVGLLMARLITFSASRLILPLLVAVALSVAGVFDAAVVPPPITAVGFAAIGLMVGLAMTRSTVRVILRILPLALAQLVLVLSLCALIGLALARLTGMSGLDAYLASTPGGLPAVTAIAVSSGASVGLVVTIQLVRVLLALGLAAALGEWFVRRGVRPAAVE